jgi:hypothetical protein
MSSIASRTLTGLGLTVPRCTGGCCGDCWYCDGDGCGGGGCGGGDRFCFCLSFMNSVSYEVSSIEPFCGAAAACAGDAVPTEPLCSCATGDSSPVPLNRSSSSSPWWPGTAFVA